MQAPQLLAASSGSLQLPAPVSAGRCRCRTVIHGSCHLLGHLLVLGVRCNEGTSMLKCQSAHAQQSVLPKLMQGWLETI